MKVLLINGNKRTQINPIGDGKFEVSNYRIIDRHSSTCENTKVVELREATETYNSLVDGGYTAEPIF